MCTRFRTLLPLLLGLFLAFSCYGKQPDCTFSDGFFTYKTLDSVSVELVKCDKKAEGDIRFAETVSYNGKSYKITSIGDYAFKNCENVSRVFLPNELKVIGYCSFYGCRNLSSINIPNKVTSIGVEAFNYCTGLSKIFIPASVNEIGDGAFWHNWALKSITVDVANKDYVDVNGVLFSKNWTRLIVYPAGKTDQMFTLPANTTTIGAGAFSNCKDLTTVVLPKDLVEIRRFAFQECNRLVSITIPNAIEVLEQGVFSGCTGLRQVSFPKKMKRIGDRAFENCASLTNVVLPDGVSEIGSRAFAGCAELKNVALPRTLVEIDEEAYADCEQLASIHLFGTKPPKVGANAFSKTVFEKATLYVKYFAAEAYQHAEDWTNFQFIYKERATYRPYGTNY